MCPSATAVIKQTVRVFYAKAYPTTEEHFKWLLDTTHLGKFPTEEQFKQNYTLMWTDECVDEGVDGKHLAERYFHDFNDYSLNPLSAENDGQKIVKDSMAAHTSMSVGDIVVVGKTAYFCADFGFDVLPFQVDASSADRDNFEANLKAEWFKDDLCGEVA